MSRNQACGLSYVLNPVFRSIDPQDPYSPTIAPQTVQFKTLEVDGLNIAYREAGDKSKPKLVLLHGFPSSSHQYRNLIPALADLFHVIAPDLPRLRR